MRSLFHPSLHLRSLLHLRPSLRPRLRLRPLLHLHPSLHLRSLLHLCPRLRPRLPNANPPFLQPYLNSNVSTTGLWSLNSKPASMFCTVAFTLSDTRKPSTVVV